METSLDVLALGAHPDDVEMTCGGLLLKMKEKGYRTGALHLSAGEMGSRGTREDRIREAERAAEILRLDRMEILGFPDSRIGDGLEEAEKVARFLLETRPRLVLAPFPRDPHPDHGAAGRIASRAVHLASLGRFAGPGEPHLAGQVLFAMCRALFRPNVIIDVSDQFQRKMEAVLAYRSQVGPAAPGEKESRLSSPLFLRSWEARHLHYGACIGRAYGEPYYTEYAIPLEDPVAAFPVPQQRRIALEALV